RVRVLHLSEDLRFADDERIESARDPEQVPRGVEILLVVQMRRQFVRWHTVELGHKAREIRACRGCVLAGNVELGAIASGHDRRFVGRPAPRDAAQRLADATRLEIDALAQIDRCRAMTDSDEQEMHETRYLVIWLLDWHRCSNAQMRTSKIVALREEIADRH